MAIAVNPTCYHISASSIAAFKACPTRFRLGYREGLRLAEDTESQRVGTNWHKMHECYANALTNEHWGKDVAIEAVVKLLNNRYENIPASKTVAEWKLERQILLTCFLGYLWYYQNDPIEFLASELPFNLPLYVPKLGLPLPMDEVQRVGKIDHVIKWQNSVCALERKSTSRSIAPDSDYWEKARKDTQVSMYAAAFRELSQHYIHDDSHHLRWVDDLIEHDIELVGRFGNTLYDVWHKPTIKPKELTQAQTAEFIQTSVYMGSEFKVGAITGGLTPKGEVTVLVDSEVVEVIPGKKGFAIRETIEMFGARLMQDIYERPEFYFVRREIARTDADLTAFRRQLFSIYQAQKLAGKYSAWVENESQCRATFPCPYIPICYGPGADAVCDGTTTPNGFKRIFVDLTVNGEAIEE